MPAAIVRTAWHDDAVVATGQTTSAVLEIWDASFGMLFVPAEFDGTAITFTVCDTYGGTYLPLEGEDGSAISLTTNASSATPLPAELFGAAYCKLVCGTSQTGATTFRVTLKG